jgi:aspartyl-tRNA(Asn)/glutamyl-tRNA(Gln) amidotransferase subunit B
MRTKEDAHDYRYIPDPDLMPHTPTEEWLAHVKECMVELPLARKQRLMAEYQLPECDADVLVADSALADYFEIAAKGVANPKTVANWIINNLQAKLTESETSLADVKFTHAGFSELVGFVESGKINSKIAQEVFAEMFSTGKAPAEIVVEKDLSQVSDVGELERLCREAIEANPGPSEDYRKGKEAALNFLKGQVMKASRGKANPQMVGDLIKKTLIG